MQGIICFIVVKYNDGCLWHDILKYGTLTILNILIWRGLRKGRNKLASLTTSLTCFSPETGNKTFMWQVPFLYLEEVLATQLCLILCDPIDCRLLCLGGILQARILEWVANPFSRRSSQTRDQTWVSWIAGGFFTIWATREAYTWRKEVSLSQLEGTPRRIQTKRPWWNDPHLLELPHFP